MRNKVLNAVLILLSLTVSVAVAEVAARSAKLTRDSYLVLFRADPDFKFHYRPNQNLTTLFGEHITIDGFGHRVTGQHGRSKGGNAYRVLILGDSVGFGLNVDDSHLFTRGLSESLSQRMGRPVEIINGSCESYNTFNELAWYRKEGRHYGADEVWLLYVSNDVATAPSSFYVSPDGYSTQNPDSIVPLALRFHLRRSALALLAHATITNVLAAQSSSARVDAPVEIRELAMQALADLVDEVSSEATLRVFYLPRRVEVESGKRSEIYDWVAQTVTGFGISDLTDPLRASYERNESPFLPNDPVHLSAAGHSVLRQVLLAAQGS